MGVVVLNSANRRGDLRPSRAERTAAGIAQGLGDVSKLLFAWQQMKDRAEQDKLDREAKQQGLMLKYAQLLGVQQRHQENTANQFQLAKDKRESDIALEEKKREFRQALAAGKADVQFGIEKLHNETQRDIANQARQEKVDAEARKRLEDRQPKTEAERIMDALGDRARGKKGSYLRDVPTPLLEKRLKSLNRGQQVPWLQGLVHDSEPGADPAAGDAPAPVAPPTQGPPQAAPALTPQAAQYLQGLQPQPTPGQ